MAGHPSKHLDTGAFQPGSYPDESAEPEVILGSAAWLAALGATADPLLAQPNAGCGSLLGNDAGRSDRPDTPLAHEAKD